jgi:hypothetical protein
VSSQEGDEDNTPPLAHTFMFPHTAAFHNQARAEEANNKRSPTVRQPAAYALSRRATANPPWKGPKRLEPPIARISKIN